MPCARRAPARRRANQSGAHALAARSERRSPSRTPATRKMHGTAQVNRRCGRPQAGSLERSGSPGAWRTRPGYSMRITAQERTARNLCLQCGGRYDNTPLTPLGCLWSPSAAACCARACCSCAAACAASGRGRTAQARGYAGVDGRISTVAILSPSFVRRAYAPLHGVCFPVSGRRAGARVRRCAAFVFVLGAGSCSSACPDSQGAGREVTARGRLSRAHTKDGQH